MILVSLMAAMLSGAEAAPVAEKVQEAVAPRAGRELYICARDEASRRAFKRRFGEVVFVSAREVVDSRTDGSAWAVPRCITQKEYLRLEKLTSKTR
ncbi:MAG TPA: hypothetical protein VEA44_11240 [Caulobacter sp.]|nr:hypothetical protein [Caulobacter sp.]